IVPCWTAFGCLAIGFYVYGNVVFRVASYSVDADRISVVTSDSGGYLITAPEQSAAAIVRLETDGTKTEWRLPHAATNLLASLYPTTPGRILLSFIHPSGSQTYQMSFVETNFGGPTGNEV